MLFISGLSVSVLALTFIGVAGIRRWAIRKQMLDIPNVRSSHTHPIPRGGGLAIVGVVLVGLWLYAAVRSPCVPWLALWAYTFGALLIAGVSWLDDLRPLSVWVRFSAHGLGAFFAIIGFGYCHAISLPFFGNVPLCLLGFPLTLLWIIGLTNAYNFMDGIDGIAGGQAVVAGLGWAILGRLSGQPLVGILGLLTAACSLGFLGHNWPPARIFMGDVGSAFLGFTFAALTVLASRSNPVFVLAGIALVWPFAFDTTLTFFRRLCRGENVCVAHRSHIYQRLVISGLSHQQVSSLYIGLAMIGLVWAVALVQEWRWVTEAGAVVISVAALGMWTWTRHREHTSCDSSS